MSQLTANLLRFTSIFFVLVIHASAPWEQGFLRDHVYLSDDFLAVLMNQLARFCVPVFVIISGYGLSKKYQKTEFDIKSFFSGRLYKIGLPFLVLTLVILLFHQKFPYDQGAGLTQNLLQWADTLLIYLVTRGADYHFYFFTIILECYLVFPYLYRVNSRVLFILLLLNQVIFTAPSHLLFQKLGWYRPAFASSFLIYWVFYFYAGIFWAKNEIQTRELLRSVKAGWFLMAGFFIFSLVMVEYIYWSSHYQANQQAEAGWYNHFHRQSVILYSLFILSCFIRFDQKIQAWLSSYQSLFATLAGLSFSVYIFHTWILRLLKQTFLASDILVLVTTLTIASFTLFYLISKLKMPRLLRTLLGLS